MHSGCGEAVKRLLKINGNKIREQCFMNIEVEFNNIAATYNKGEMRMPPKRKAKWLE